MRQALQQQAQLATELGSPFMSQLCMLMAQHLRPDEPVGRAMLSWPGDPIADAFAYRLAGPLHTLILDGKAPELAAVYPPHPQPPADQLWQQVQATIDAHTDYILERLKSPPQTNETRRCIALCAGMLTVAARTGLPLVCSELGSSAGLNLLWHKFHYRFGHAPDSPQWGDPHSPVKIDTEWQGPTPPVPPVQVVETVGCDLRPINLQEDAIVTRLLGYIWPDQQQRLARARAAIQLARDAGIVAEQEDAAVWLQKRLAQRRSGAVHVVFHSIVWQYLPEATKARIQSLLDEAGSRADASAPIAWVRMEPEGHETDAGIKVTMWPGGLTEELGRVHFHGQWLHWK